VQGLDANSVAIDIFCTWQFSKTTNIPNKAHSKPHPLSIMVRCLHTYILARVEL